jgi:DNA-binding CsgD family transcriptional regulator
MDYSVNNTETCIFILDKDLNLISASRSANTCNCWHDALIFQDNRLTGISGVHQSKFRTNIFNGSAGKRTILLRATGKSEEGNRQLLKITPLFDSTAPSPATNVSSVCLEIQTLDTFYSNALQTVSEKYNLTKAETLVLKCLMMGLTSDEIEEKMKIGTPTLRTHQNRLRQKTGESTSLKMILSALNPENHADDLIEFDDF